MTKTNLNKKPIIPRGYNWTIEEHRDNPKDFSIEKIELYLSDEQREGKRITGHDLRRLLAYKPVLNANVLDWLLDHPDQIPETWKEKKEWIFLLGV